MTGLEDAEAMAADGAVLLALVAVGITCAKFQLLLRRIDSLAFPGPFWFERLWAAVMAPRWLLFKLRSFAAYTRACRDGQMFTAPKGRWVSRCGMTSRLVGHAVRGRRA